MSPMFENPEISLDDLPRVESVSWQPMDDSLALQLVIQQLLFVFIITAGSVGFRFMPNVTFLPAWLHLLIIVGITIPLVVWPYLSVKKRGIAVRDKDVLYKSGLVVNRLTAIPFNRIQHVETKQGPLDRQFETASLQIFTAGGSKGDLDIAGMERDRAESLRSMILKRIGSSIEDS
ncbi:MAG: PH domain-containing protein [Woeseiaceae bacterium]|nr:PH domain-containing protein [Woeseiaceae bacterium]